MLNIQTRQYRSHLKQFAKLEKSYHQERPHYCLFFLFSFSFFFLVRNGTIIEQSWIAFSWRCSMISLDEIVRVAHEEKIFKSALKVVIIFYYYAFTSTWQKNLNFILTNLNPFYQRMFRAILGCKWPSGSRGEYENVES